MNLLFFSLEWKVILPYLDLGIFMPPPPNLSSSHAHMRMSPILPRVRQFPLFPSCDADLVMASVTSLAGSKYLGASLYDEFYSRSYGTDNFILECGDLNLNSEQQSFNSFLKSICLKDVQKGRGRRICWFTPGGFSGWGRARLKP